jgi:hypothetical protein
VQENERRSFSGRYRKKVELLHLPGAVCDVEAAFTLRARVRRELAIALEIPLVIRYGA